ncbi:MAG: DNA repair protein RadC [Eubacteriales bacterium]|nr:DNA repair protein RadC [Eubacteriales bacterium]
MKIKELCPSDKPYEKLERLGPKALSDKELLAILIRSGTSRQSALQIAEALLLHTDSTLCLNRLHTMTMAELLAVPGIGRVRAVQIKALAELSIRMAKRHYPERPLMNSPERIADYYMEELRHLDHEELWMASLDIKGRLIHTDSLFKGAVSSCTVSPREIFLTALNRRAVNIILIHNHPSGNCEPSQADIAITRRVADVGVKLDVSLWDHIIIGDREYYSFKENNLF